MNRNMNWWVPSRSQFYFSSSADSIFGQTTVRTETIHEPKTEPEAPVHLKETGPHPITDLDNNIVGWDGQDDPENPR